VIKLRRMRWTENVAHMGEINAYGVIVGEALRKTRLRTVCLDGSVNVNVKER
jgi:hypothetical protein